MATIFDILNSINNNNNHSNYYSCKRQKSNNNNNFRDNSIKRIDIIPSMDVTITDDNIIIETELAGISKDNIEIDIKDSILTIQGEKKINNNYKQKQQQQHSDKAKTNINFDEPLIEENKKEFNKYLSERSFGNFKRCLDLTSILYQLDFSTIKTNFENGLLIITINKKSDLSNSSFKININ
ncbi:hypothetical protein ACTFIY_003341 [Dictyostelium cf. discoideum]